MQRLTASYLSEPSCIALADLRWWGLRLATKHKRSGLFLSWPYDLQNRLQEIAGEGSALARTCKVHAHHAAVATLPENYEERLIELLPGRFKNLSLLVLVLDPYDIVLSKSSWNLEKDREDVAYLVKTQHLDPKVLRKRYDEELRISLIGPTERRQPARRSGDAHWAALTIDCSQGFVQVNRPTVVKWLVKHNDKQDGSSGRGDGDRNASTLNMS